MRVLHWRSSSAALQKTTSQRVNDDSIPRLTQAVQQLAVCGDQVWKWLKGESEKWKRKGEKWESEMHNGRGGEKGKDEWKLRQGKEVRKGMKRGEKLGTGETGTNKNGGEKVRERKRGQGHDERKRGSEEGVMRRSEGQEEEDNEKKEGRRWRVEKEKEQWKDMKRRRRRWGENTALKAPPMGLEPANHRPASRLPPPLANSSAYELLRLTQSNYKERVFLCSLTFPPLPHFFFCYLLSVLPPFFLLHSCPIFPCLLLFTHLFLLLLLPCSSFPFHLSPSFFNLWLLYPSSIPRFLVLLF